MKKHFIILAALILLMTSFTGCAVVGGIFKAGMWWGIILVGLVVAGIIYLLTRGGRK
jgi:flagellar biosynthesis protein FliP